jgi:acyl dehydratase
MTKPSELAALIGTEVGVSKWFEIDQARINAFADATEDWQFIHMNPEAAAATPFGGTIAHGFLTLSLASAMSYDAVPPLDGVVMGVNYGFDKLRFLAPVPAGSKVRGRFKLLSAEDKGPNPGGGHRWLIKHELTVEIDGSSKPALIAEWLGMQMVE